ncbi:hypothetical protein MLOOGBEN_14450 [Bacillus sp. EB106-08-02-XG196]|uniref:hypothetical protein n=1 Tax=Bacillus sp. EB106-08-02-XG196 TaxID=2737049 RepID=UPI0015C43DF0|nr:hypothetical protein [Bacillus sp. EB106-08-02-XG196]NWQ41897.1 hypothetical protein [Bacillus sp. EB106-08-02-XG196]
MRLVLHKLDEGHIRKFLIEISPSSGLREKNQHLSLTKPIDKSHQNRPHVHSSSGR